MGNTKNKILKRKYDLQDESKVVFIFTEGKRTEPNYFEAKKKSIRKSNIQVEVIGLGDNTKSLVEFVIEFISKNKIDLRGDAYECWVVFDKDDHQYFNEAVALAKENDLKVAYSNECFELWILLHFIYCDSALHRKDLKKKLEKIMKKEYGVTYAKNMDNLYELICSNEDVAIKGSKKLLKIHEKEASYIKKNPSTTVHLLVERLNIL